LAVPIHAIPKREIEIGQRVREGREFKGLTQQACSDLTGIERSTLANYEAGVTALTYEKSRRICYRLNVNQRWLATGIQPQIPYFDLSPNLEFSIKENSLFSKAFDDILRPEIERRFAELIQFLGEDAVMTGNYEDAIFDNLHLVGEEAGPAAAFYITKAIAMRGKLMPEPLQAKFAQTLMKAEQSFLNHNREEIEKLSEVSRSVEKAIQKGIGNTKFGLTVKVTSLTSDFVKPVLPKLIERLRRATKHHGSKAALAKWLGVHRQMVTDWLSGKQEPGGEITLRLLQWVEQQERQK
jgi:transcriptional regulator with XRE-family HTH domain